MRRPARAGCAQTGPGVAGATIPGSYTACDPQKKGTTAQVVDSYRHRGHAAFVSKLNKPRSDKGLQGMTEGYQQSYPQKIWTSAESLEKSSTCHRKCMRNPMTAARHTTFLGCFCLLTAQLCTCLAQRRRRAVLPRQCPRRAGRHDKDH